MKDYTNLKEKTVFDFCSDEKILKEVLPYIPVYVFSNPDLKIKYLDYWKQHRIQHAFSFLDLAEIIKDDELERQAEQQFAKDLEEHFNE
ncbi:MAG: hypothetical protein K2K88_07285 [Muribaculaceae bacterium]|nr:hypothetical protein [Muribaculaceae bacterium]